MPDEEPLAGGNVSTGVVRVGDTVRRPAGSWTPAVHALLTYLRAAGFDGAPEPLGIDDKGREVIRFIPGTVAWGEGFRLLQPARELARAGRLIREFHDAVAGFVPPADAHWQVNILPDRAEIIAHNDLAPWNLVIGDQWTFIDWDMAAPGSRLWDLAWASLGFVPLSADPQLQAPDAAGRLRIFVDAYGLDDGHERQQLAVMLGTRARSMYQFLADRAAHSIEPWASLWHQGHGEAWRNHADYIDGQAARWQTALLA
jgi:Ser/Thr protein kinase RdoA (MazF antagonist)